MPTQIYVNLPVKDLKKSIEFFTKLGYSFNPQFTDETGTCMIVSESIYVMLLTQEKFMMFSPKPICDSNQFAEVLLCITCDSRNRVDELVRLAVAAGGATYSEPQDHGFMYGHGFQDLDGHLWELFSMDENAFQDAEVTP
jgi:predicted lactoylglutathione lyase